VNHRFLRAILSVNDEFYHRHIVQHNLFAPVFEAFRANPVGDNLVSSAIVEMCDFIHTENIKSLIEYIVAKHLSATNTEALLPSLEDVSSPYVSTLTVLRKAYEKNLKGGNKAQSVDAQEQPQGGSDDSHSRYFHGNSVVRTSRVVLNEKALEDQVRTGIILKCSMFVVCFPGTTNMAICICSVNSVRWTKKSRILRLMTTKAVVRTQLCHQL
jgi:hypothetical protein